MTAGSRLAGKRSLAYKSRNRVTLLTIDSQTLLSLLSLLHATGGTAYTPAMAATSLLMAANPTFPRVRARRQSATCTDDSASYTRGSGCLRGVTVSAPAPPACVAASLLVTCFSVVTPAVEEV